MSNATAVQNDFLTDKTFFLGLQKLAFTENRPYAFFRLPNSHEVSFLAGAENGVKEIAPNFTDLPLGFAIAPFQWHEKLFYFEAEYRSNFKTKEIYFNNKAIAADEIFTKKTDSTAANKFYWAKNKDIFAEKKDYQAIVSKAVKAMEAKEFAKVVLSRTENIDFSVEFSVFDSFMSLCDWYPRAFVCFFSSPQTGTWMCATPELLVSHDENHIFRTVALAGTQVHTGLDLKNYAWAQKEIEEQAMVSRYIIDCFKKIRLREFQEIGPQTINAGNIVHLRTDFNVDTAKTSFPDLPSVMCQLLHPTSAVCGMPKEITEKFIPENEGYDREFYSGFLGPIFGKNSLALFVHLRCMQLFENHATLYAGAGITADSEPEKEWHETAQKLKTIGKIFSK